MVTNGREKGHVTCQGLTPFRFRMAASKKLPYLKIGDRVLFDIKSLDQWVDKHLIREKEWKRQELKPEIEEGISGSKSKEDSDLLNILEKG